MEQLANYSIPVIVGICVCVGYIIKHLIPSNKINRFIPLIVGVLGVLLNMWLKFGISPEILLEGLVSGLSSTGLYELVDKLSRG